MTDRQLLSEDELRAGLAELGSWALHEGKLRREFRFADFVAAFGFMTRLALEAEKACHHPEWSNVYDRVVIELQTHTAGGITAADLELARTADRLALRT